MLYTTLLFFCFVVGAMATDDEDDVITEILEEIQSVCKCGRKSIGKEFSLQGGSSEDLKRQEEETSLMIKFAMEKCEEAACTLEAMDHFDQYTQTFRDCAKIFRESYTAREKPRTRSRSPNKHKFSFLVGTWAGNDYEVVVRDDFTFSIKRLGKNFEGKLHVFQNSVECLPKMFDNQTWILKLDFNEMELIWKIPLGKKCKKGIQTWKRMQT